VFETQEYQLLDFGNGRRLERFGPLVLDRPCPAAENVDRADPAAWEQADARFERTEGKLGRWIADHPLPERWTVAHGPITLELKPTEFGHLGVFPEQAANWEWLTQKLRNAPPPVKILNLFAYTGASTLAAAAAGAETVHVDAARNVVAWARRNAQASGLVDAPVRWITEDAVKFVRRELERGNTYQAVILDPPSYGHGRRGELWRIAKHLPRLLAMCNQLMTGESPFVLLTCHTPKFGPDRLARLVSEAFGDGRVAARPLTLPAATGRELPSGVVVRWEGGV
jgi:23S rRNA (cytosine1962-C5)-methyltransferase